MRIKFCSAPTTAEVRSRAQAGTLREKWWEEDPDEIAAAQRELAAEWRASQITALGASLGSLGAPGAADQPLTPEEIRAALLVLVSLVGSMQ